MAGKLVAILCVILITVGVVTSKIMRFSADKPVARPGESIVLTCEFVDLDSHDTMRFSKHHPGNKTTVLTAQYDLSETLSGANRFNFSYTEFGSGVVTQVLTILSAVPGDSGNYSCFMRDLDKNKTTYNAYLEITVEDEPDTIELFLNDVPVENGSHSVPLRFLESSKLRCQTTRSNPGASITVTYGNGKHVPLTSLIVSNATYQLDERDPDYDYLVPIYRNTTALVNNWVFELEAYGKPIVCSAKVGRDAPGITTSFTPVVADGPPQIGCNDTVYARNGQRSFVINCTAYAKPALTKAQFLFMTGKTNYVLDGFPLNQQRMSEDRKFSGIVQPYDNVKSSMLLTVDTVDLKAKITFNFLVDNGRGQDIHQVTIKDPAMASSSTALSTCLIAFLFIWLIGFGIRGQL